MAMVQTKNKKTQPKNTTKTSAKRRPYHKRIAEADGIYFLKLVIVVILSTLWLKLATPISWQGIPLGAFPIGAMVTLIAIRLYEKDPYDRKIWFAVLLVVTILSYFVPAGVVI